MARKTAKEVAPQEESGRGLGLLSLVAGLATGVAAWWVTERFLDGPHPSPTAMTSLQGLINFSMAWLLLVERREILKPLAPALAIAALLAWPSWFMAGADASSNFDLDSAPLIFWYSIAAPLSFYLLLALAKAVLETGAPPKYASVFFHGLTLPLVALGSSLFALLALVLLFAWAALLKQMGVTFFSELFDEPWFIMPFVGAVSGLSIAMIRGQRAVLGALRFLVLLFSRIAMPITAAFSLTFLVVLMTKGSGAILGADVLFGRPAAIILFLSFAGMLLFNGVYQNGEGAPPPLWLRLSTIIAIALFPVYSGLAAQGLWMRIGEYGLTPTRLIGALMVFLAFAYSLVLIAGLLSELNWRAARWMAPVAPLNILMAIAWIVALIGVSSPIFNGWAISARSQERLLLSGKADALKFDYGYLRFKLGRFGDAALDRLAEASAHPQAAEIRNGVARARKAQSYWEYQNPEYAEPEIADDTLVEAPAPGGALDLELNPDGAPPER